MARITVEDCLTQQTNRFGLVLLAAKRAKQLLHGAKQAIEDNRGNKAIVTALREIADGQVRFMSDEEAREAREREAADAESRRAAAAAAVPARTAELTVRDIFIEDPAAEKEESTENRNGSSANGI